MAKDKIDFEPIEFEEVPEQASQEAAGIDFEPTPHLDEQPITQNLEPNVLQSLGGGVQQGTTLGFADELAGLSGALGSMSGGDQGKFSDLYKQALNEARQQYHAEEVAHPVASFTGNLAGGLLLPIGAGAGAAKEGMTLAQAGKAGLISGAKTGAALGGVTGLGASEGQSTQDLLKDAALGAGIGGVGGAAIGQAVPYLAKGLQQGLEGGSVLARKAAESAAERAIGVTPGQTERLLEQAAVQGRDLGSTILDKNLLPLVGGPEEILARTQAAQQAEGSKIGSLVNEASNVPANQMPSNISSDIDELIKNIQQKSKYQYGVEAPSQKAVQDLAQTKDVLQNIGNNPQELLQAKQALGQQLKSTDWYKEPDSLKKNIVKDLYGSTKEQLENVVDQNLGVEKGQAFKEANKQYSNLATIEDTAKKADLKTQSKGPITFGDIALATAAGTVGGGPVSSIGALAAKKGIELGTGYTLGQLYKVAGARGLDTLSKQLSSMGNAEASMFGRVLNKAASSDEQTQKATIYLLQQNPAFRSLFSNKDKVKLNEVKE